MEDPHHSHNGHSRSRPIVLCGIGGPACGISTVTEHLVKEVGCRKLHLLDVAKKIGVDAKTQNIIETHNRTGYLVPDWIVQPLIGAGIQMEENVDRLVLDKLTRTMGQANLVYNTIVHVRKAKLVCYFLNTPRAESRRRAFKRQAEEDRADGHPETIETRFDQYDQFTVKAVRYLHRRAELDSENVQFINVPWKLRPEDRYNYVAFHAGLVSHLPPPADPELADAMDGPESFIPVSRSPSQVQLS